MGKPRDPLTPTETTSTNSSATVEPVKEAAPAPAATTPTSATPPLATGDSTPIDDMLNELMKEVEKSVVTPGPPSAAAPSAPTPVEPAPTTIGGPTLAEEADKLLEDFEKYLATPAPTPAAAPSAPTPAEPAPTPKTVAPSIAVSASPSTPHAGGKLTASTETTYKREMMIKKKEAFEKVLQTHAQPYTDWKLEEKVKDAKVTHLSVTDKTNKERFTIHLAEIKTTEDNVDTFKAMLKCYKAANAAGKIPTITAYSEEGKKLWQQAVKEVYAKELSVGMKIEVNRAPTIAPPAPKPATPAPSTEETPTLRR